MAISEEILPANTYPTDQSDGPHRKDVTAVSLCEIDGYWGLNNNLDTCPRFFDWHSRAPS